MTWICNTDIAMSCELVIFLRFSHSLVPKRPFRVYKIMRFGGIFCIL